MGSRFRWTTWGRTSVNRGRVIILVPILVLVLLHHIPHRGRIYRYQILFVGRKTGKFDRTITNINIDTRTSNISISINTNNLSRKTEIGIEDSSWI